MKGARWLVHDGASPAGRQICITASVADQSASFEPSIVAAISAGTPTARATSVQAKASIMTISLLLPESPALRLGAQHA
jgi:hypothetical protein